jgi:ferredoxin
MTLGDDVIGKLAGSARAVGFDGSRCLRTRFNKSRCDLCARGCEAGAISLTPGPVINDETCTGCMLCVSACPAEALRADGFNFLRTLDGLKKAAGPVLGCTEGEGLRAHEKTPCLGFLSEEHIIALLSMLEGRVQLNLIGCADCRNAITLPVLRQRVRDVVEKTRLDATGRMVFALQKAGLDYRDIPYDRRGFFSAIKRSSLEGTAEIIGGFLDKKASMPFARKALPLRRALLNSVFSTAGGVLREGLLRNYYHALSVDGSCDLCFACMGVCPSGAIKVERERPEDGVMFKSSLCSGCGLCEGFCMNGSISLVKGYSGEDPFEFHTAGGQREKAAAPGD